MKDSKKGQNIAVIDYGMGNLKSVLNSLKEIGSTGEIVSDSGMLDLYDKAILPGVGAFCEAIRHLDNTGFSNSIRTFASQGKLLLGICLGMQLLCNDSKEDGFFEGLGLIDANVLPFPKKNQLKVPHMGWNSIHMIRKDIITKNVLSGNDVYFVHSYYVKNNNVEDIVAVSDYGFKFTSIMRRKNIIGMQFHPEKSQEIGLALLKNFVSLEC